MQLLGGGRRNQREVVHFFQLHAHGLHGGLDFLVVGPAAGAASSFHQLEAGHRAAGEQFGLGLGADGLAPGLDQINGAQQVAEDGVVEGALGGVLDLRRHRLRGIDEIVGHGGEHVFGQRRADRLGLAESALIVAGVEVLLVQFLVVAVVLHGREAALGAALDLLAELAQGFDRAIPLADVVEAGLHDDHAHALEVAQEFELVERGQGVNLQLLVVLGIDLDASAILQIDDDQFVAGQDHGVGRALGVGFAGNGLDAQALLDHEFAVDAAHVVDVLLHVAGHVVGDFPALAIHLDDAAQVGSGIVTVRQCHGGQFVRGRAFVGEVAGIVRARCLKGDAAGAVQPAVCAGWGEFGVLAHSDTSSLSVSTNSPSASRAYQVSGLTPFSPTLLARIWTRRPSFSSR